MRDTPVYQHLEVVCRLISKAARKYEVSVACTGILAQSLIT